MLTFKQYLYLTEAKAKDVLAKYPHLSHLDPKYVSAYGMHLGKITSPNDDPTKIKSVVEAFHKDKNSLPVDKRDITKYKSIGEISSALKPLQQKRESKQATETLYSDPKTGVEIKHVKTRQACEAGYGGGKTSWCVAASGGGNLFDSYGKGGKKMFTVHHKGKVYGIHEHENGAIRDEQNRDVRESLHPDIWKAMSKVPELSKVNLMSGNPHITSEHIEKALEHDDPDVRRAAASHPHITSEQLHKALDDDDWRVRIAAARHPNATSEHLHKALGDRNELVREVAARHPNATSEHLHKALNDEYASVRLAAASHPNATSEHLHKALDDDDPVVRRAAAEHPNATSEQLHKSLDDRDELVRRAAQRNLERRKK